MHLLLLYVIQQHMKRRVLCNKILNIGQFIYSEVFSDLKKGVHFALCCFHDKQHSDEKKLKCSTSYLNFLVILKCQNYFLQSLNYSADLLLFQKKLHSHVQSYPCLPQNADLIYLFNYLFIYCIWFWFSAVWIN